MRNVTARHRATSARFESLELPDQEGTDTFVIQRGWGPHAAVLAIVGPRGAVKGDVVVSRGQLHELQRALSELDKEGTA